MGANRRAVLAGLAGLPFAAVPAVATPSRVLAGSEEPIVILRRRFLTHMAVVDHYNPLTGVVGRRRFLRNRRYGTRRGTAYAGLILTRMG